MKLLSEENYKELKVKADLAKKMEHGSEKGFAHGIETVLKKLKNFN